VLLGLGDVATVDFELVKVGLSCPGRAVNTSSDDALLAAVDKHTLVGYSNIAGTGIDARLTTLYEGGNCLRVRGLCQVDHDDSKPLAALVGAPQGGPIANSFCMSADWGGNQWGDVWLGFYNLPAVGQFGAYTDLFGTDPIFINISPGRVFRPLTKALNSIRELPAGFIFVILREFCPQITFRFSSIVPTGAPDGF